MDLRHTTTIEEVLEHRIANGATDPGRIFGQIFEPAMQIEREQHLKAAHCERTPERQGYANGYKPKRIDTPAGTVTVEVPKTAGHGDRPFHPQAPDRGRRSSRAVMPAVAEMDIKRVSTRQAEDVMRAFGIESLSSSHLSRATRLLDDELAAWRNRPLGLMKYLILDARCEKARHDGVVRDGEADQKTIRGGC
jgi:transposase-like protein